jgi:HD-GYP domain-containing protein (c-di-GMP phosphodiesterase class II)
LDSIKFVPVELLLNEEGVIAGDVATSSSTLLLPSGLPISALRETHPGVVELLKTHGITKVPVKKSPFITMEEFRGLLDRVRPPLSLLNPLVTRVAAHQMEAVYKNIRSRQVREKGIRSLALLGEALCRHIRKKPQITLSLGEEEGWRESPFIHGVNTSLLAGYIAAGFSPPWPEFVEAMTIAGLLHDIGKSFLTPFSRPSAKEKRQRTEDDRGMRTHPILGEAMLRDAGINKPYILSAVRSHHESWDGSGYPDGLAGEAIPMGGRVLAVANFFENLLSSTASPDKKRSDQAVSSLLASANGRFDKLVVRVLLASVGLFPPGSVVELSDERVGVVLESRDRDLMRPNILLITGKESRKDEPPTVIDLKKSGPLFIRKVYEDYGKMKVVPLDKDERPSVLFRKYRAPRSMDSR